MGKRSILDRMLGLERESDDVKRAVHHAEEQQAHIMNAGGHRYVKGSEDHWFFRSGAIQWK